MAEATGEADDPRRAAGRASAWVACAVVVGIAVVAASGVVAWARLGAGPQTRGPPDPVPVDEEVPTALVGEIDLGEVPDAVAAAFDGPVVGARLLDDVPDGAGCGFVGPEFDGDPEVETVLATPDVLQVSVLGTGRDFAPPGADGAPALMRATCTVRWERGQWMEGGGSVGPADGPPGGSMGMSCCDERGLGTAEATVVAPDGARWAVQDRGSFHLAYPVPDSGVVPVSWRFRDQGAFGEGMGSSATRVTFVDGAGEVLDEVTVRS